MKKQLSVTLLILMLVNFNVLATPTNEQLYQMLLELKAEQGKLKLEATQAKKRESDLRLELNQTKQELVSAKKQLNPSLAYTEQQDTLDIEEGFFISAGGIYVRPLIDREGVTEGVGVTEGNELDYEAGFQISLGYQASDNWDYTLKFKHFNANEKIDNTSFDNLLGSGGSIAAPKLKYKMNYDVLDFEIGKQFSLSDTVTLRLSGGLRYAALDERWNEILGGIGIGISGIQFIETKYESDFWGVGPRITASPIWKPFSNNFRIFGNVGTAFLMGRYDISNRTRPSGIIGFVSSKPEDNREGFFTMVEAGAGIGYTFNTNLIDLDIEAGYQFEHWLDSDLTNDILFRGFHGSYGTIGVKF